MNENLPFVIPANQSTKDTKGGGKGYTYFGDPSSFTRHKQQRVFEIRTVSQEIKAEKPKISNPQQLSFLDIKLNEKATANSSIPTDLFDNFNLDVNKRLKANELVVSGTLKSIEKLKTAMADFEYVPQEDDKGNFKNKEAALLSVIENISRVSSDNKIDGIVEDNNLGIAYFYKSISEVNAKKITANLVETRGIKAKFMVSPSGAKILTGEFTADDVALIANDDFENPFAKFEVMHHIGIETKSVNLSYPSEDVQVVDESGDVLVGIIDGGIADLDIFKDFVVDRKDYTPNKNPDHHHGTLAASRVMFGHDIEDQIFDDSKLVAHAKLVDIKVMDGDDGPSPVDLIAYIEDAIKLFPKVKLFSMSLGLNDYCQRDKKSYLTRELDALQHKHGVVVVVSAGNRDDFHTMSYPDVLFDKDSLLNSPADTTNGLSVGALADKANKDSLAKIDEPSPFTRTGFDDIRKPDLAHYGGNGRANGRWRDLGVKGFDVVDNELTEDVGTSFATPVVSGELAKAHRVTTESGYSFPEDLSKAIVIHSAKYLINEDSSIDPKLLHKVIGHGVPDVDELLHADPTQVVFVMTDKVGGIKAKSKTREAVRKVRFTIPEELKSLKRQLNVRATLAYTSPIDANDEVDTAQSDVTMTLYKVNSRKNLVNSGKSDDTDFSYKPKWYTIKTLERSYTHRSFDSGEWEIRLTMQTRGDASNDDYEQPFALVVSIEDIGDDKGRLNLQEIIQNKHKQYVRINQIKNPQKVSAN